MPFITPYQSKMEINVYQELAKEYDQNPNKKVTNSYIIPLFGIIGESGALVSEFKKKFRDKDSHTKFESNVEEILGNLLWYAANVATKFDLNLESIAESNLQKIKHRFPKSGDIICVTESFDSTYSEKERLPRLMTVEFKEIKKGRSKSIVITVNGKIKGDPLTDNAYKNDGYRYHDIFHFSFAAILGWSPVVRSLLKTKRKSNSLIDEVEDGARAASIEEAISAFIYQFAKEHKFYENINKVDHQLIKTIKKLVSNLEVSKCTTAEWERAILMGYTVFRSIVKSNGGKIKVDLDNREITLVQ